MVRGSRPVGGAGGVSTVAACGIPRISTSIPSMTRRETPISRIWGRCFTSAPRRASRSGYVYATGLVNRLGVAVPALFPEDSFKVCLLRGDHSVCDGL